MENDQPQPARQTNSPDLQAQHDDLRQLVLSVLLLLVVVTGTFCIFLLRQAKTTGADLTTYRAQTTNLVAQLKPNEPLMDDLLKRFQEFGRTNADFVPYLAKYGIQPGVPIAPGAASHSAPPATAKKK